MMNAHLDKRRDATDDRGRRMHSEKPDIAGVFKLGSKLEALRVIGTGGMGTVLEVYHKELGLKRAVKLIDRFMLQKSEQVLLRFRQEAVIASELSHPNIIKVYDLDRTPDGTPFMLMEYLEGVDLENVIRTRAPLGLEEVIRLLSGPADALDAVHRKGVVHRDLKPANLFLTAKGTVKILDFGISQISSRQDVRITYAGEVVGTPMYMSPEQIMGRELDGRSDVYSLGIIAYELLLNRPIFEYESMNQVAAAVMAETPTLPLDVNPKLPLYLNDVFLKVFKKNPAQRYESAISFLRALAGPELVRIISSVIRSELVSAIDSSEFLSPVAKKNSASGEGQSNAHVQPTLEISASHVPGGTKPSGVLKKMTKGSAAALLAVMIAVIASVWVLWFKLSSMPGPAQLVIENVTVSTKDSDGDWQRRAFRHVLEMYLSVDDALNLEQTKKSTSLFSPAKKTYSLVVSAVHEDDWQIDLNLYDSNRENVFQTRSAASGFEPALDKATWQLHLFLDSDGMKAERSEAQIQQRLTKAAKAALLEQGLILRFNRIISLMPNTNERVFFLALKRYIHCALGTPANICLAQTPFVAYRDTANPAVRSLWKHFTRPLNEPLEGASCTVFDSDDAFVMALFPLLPNRKLCKLGAEEICSQMDTFWRRYECALDSSRKDMSSTALEYIFLNLQKDDAHAFYASMDVMYINGVSASNGKAWLKRMKNRYGTEDSLLSGLFFAADMAARNASSALIWARRSNGELKKTGLALEASGWLEEGQRKKIELLENVLDSAELKFDNWVRQVVLESMESVLVTQDTLLARKWLEEVSLLEENSRYIETAKELISAISEARQEEFCKNNSTSLYLLEADAVCGRYENVLSKVPITPETAVSRMNEAIWVADALFSKKRLHEAKSMYHVIESDPRFRTNHPVASVSAVKRLGDIYWMLNDREKALSLYKQYLSIWESLDIPLSDYMDANRIVSEISR